MAKVVSTWIIVWVEAQRLFEFIKFYFQPLVIFSGYSSGKLEIHPKIFVYDYISHPRHFFPGYFGMLLLEILWKFLRRLSDYLDPYDNRILELS